MGIIYNKESKMLTKAIAQANKSALLRNTSI